MNNHCQCKCVLLTPDQPPAAASCQTRHLSVMSVAQQSAFTVGLCKARKCCIWRRAGSQGWHSINLFGGRHAIFTQRSTKVGPVYIVSMLFRSHPEATLQVSELDSGWIRKDAVSYPQCKFGGIAAENWRNLTLKYVNFSALWLNRRQPFQFLYYHSTSVIS